MGPPPKSMPPLKPPFRRIRVKETIPQLGPNKRDFKERFLKN